MMRARYAHLGGDAPAEEDVDGQEKGKRAKWSLCRIGGMRRGRALALTLCLLVLWLVVRYAIKALLPTKDWNNKRVAPRSTLPWKPNRCAILLHGTPRSFSSILLPALERNVLVPNAKYACDYYVHLNNMEYEEVPSHPGAGGKIPRPDYVAGKLALAVADHYEGGARIPVVRVANSTRREVFERRRELHLNTHLAKDGSGYYWFYVPDLLRQWDGMEMAWKLMAAEGRGYDRVAMVGLERVLLAEIDVYDAKDEMEFVAWGWGIHAYGPYEAMRIWTTELFARSKGEFANIRVSSNDGGRSLVESVPSLPFGSEFSLSKSLLVKCDVEIFPDESVSLKGCGDPALNRGDPARSRGYSAQRLRALEEMLGPCAPLGRHRCSWNKEKRALWERDKKRSESKGVLSWLFPSRKSEVRDENHEAVICCIVSNEEAYLDEWIDFHLGIGFAHIYIYDNTDFELGKGGWLERRPRLYKRVTLHHFPGDEKQSPAYQHCGNTYAQRHRWVGFFDVDEFLVLRNHTNVVDFLLELGVDDGQVSMNQERMSWSDEFQFRPRPVTQRFQGQHDVFRAVKSIASVRSLADSDHHPHFAKLKSGIQIDPRGKQITPISNPDFDPALDGKTPTPWNLDYPSDVATFCHYHTKSWKEYIDKRMRGRADQSSGINQRVLDARAGVGLINTTISSTLAWDALRSVNPEYQSLFGSVESMMEQRANISADASAGICCYVKDQEAYLDEWTSYHLAIGFAAVYIYDGSDEFWMRQWGKEMSRSMPVHVTHFLGNVTDPNDKAKAWSDCAARHIKDVKSLVFMEVNDFVMFTDLSDASPVKTMASAKSSACAHQYQRVVFGTSGQYLYDPLPVTKRFLFRVNLRESLIRERIASPPLLLNTTQLRDVKGLAETLHADFSGFLQTGRWESEICKSGANPTLSNVAMYYYLRSAKECRKERGKSSTLCNLRGTVEDQFGWEQVQHYLPEYSAFNGFL